MSELLPIVVDLNPGSPKRLNESWLSMFGGAVEMMLRRMFSTGDVLEDPRFTVRGTSSQISTFGDALAAEKKYMQSFMDHGLNDPRSFSSRHELEKAIANFERETNLKWPFT